MVAAETISVGTLWLVIGIGATLIVALVGIIGFFFKRTLLEMKGDIKDNNEECAKNKGRIELVEQQQASDIKRIEQMTQLELKGLSENVGELTKNVNTLVISLAKKGITEND